MTATATHTNVKVEDILQAIRNHHAYDEIAEVDIMTYALEALEHVNLWDDETVTAETAAHMAVDWAAQDLGIMEEGDSYL
jgi:hypothetical protein